MRQQRQVPDMGERTSGRLNMGIAGEETADQRLPLNSSPASHRRIREVCTLVFRDCLSFSGRIGLFPKSSEHPASGYEVSRRVSDPGAGSGAGMRLHLLTHGF